MKVRKNSDQMGEATCPEHIREEPRERKNNQKQKDRRTWIGRPGSSCTARPGLGHAWRAAWPGLGHAWRAAQPGLGRARRAAWVLLSLFFFSLGSSRSFFDFYKVYKSSLRDLIFMWSRGKICHVRNDQIMKIEFLRLDLQAKIESFRFEMLVNNIV